MPNRQIFNGDNMSGEIVNLRQLRKQKERAEKEQKADENRFLFGQTKAQKAQRKAMKDKMMRQLDQGKLEPAKKPE
jgi:hypothetical protein